MWERLKNVRKALSQTSFWAALVLILLSNTLEPSPRGDLHILSPHLIITTTLVSRCHWYEVGTVNPI